MSSGACRPPTDARDPPPPPPDSLHSPFHPFCQPARSLIPLTTDSRSSSHLISSHPISSTNPTRCYDLRWQRDALAHVPRMPIWVAVDAPPQTPSTSCERLLRQAGIPPVSPTPQPGPILRPSTALSIPSRAQASSPGHLISARDRGSGLALPPPPPPSISPSR